MVWVNPPTSKTFDFFIFGSWKIMEMFRNCVIFVDNRIHVKRKLKKSSKMCNFFRFLQSNVYVWTLYSKIRDGHRSASDKPYFCRSSHYSYNSSQKVGRLKAISYFCIKNNYNEYQTTTETTQCCHILRCRSSSLYENMHRCLS
jgi:hypothetical protein